MLLSDFRPRGPISIPISLSRRWQIFFYADAETNVYPLPVSWYFISSSLWWYLCSCAHTMSRLWSIADAVSSGVWSILLKVLTLNVTICIVLLHLSNFCLCLNTVADFSNSWARASVERTFFTRAKGDVVWTWRLSESHDNLSMAVF